MQLEPLVNFVAALTRPEAAGGNAAPEVHEELALALCCEAALEPDEKEGGCCRAASRSSSSPPAARASPRSPRW